jgi:hypothetical protein
MLRSAAAMSRVIDPPGTPQTLLNNCVVSGDLADRPLIVRSPITFALTGINAGGHIVQTNINAAELLVSGILGANYRLGQPPCVGSLAFSFNGVLGQHAVTPDGPAEVDCAGDYGSQCQTVNPHWRDIFRTTWETPWEERIAHLALYRQREEIKSALAHAGRSAQSSGVHGCTFALYKGDAMVRRGGAAVPTFLRRAEGVVRRASRVAFFSGRRCGELRPGRTRSGLNARTP